MYDHSCSKCYSGSDFFVLKLCFLLLDSTVGASGNGLERGFADPFESYMKQSVELQNPG